MNSKRVLSADAAASNAGDGKSNTKEEVKEEEGEKEVVTKEDAVGAAAAAVDEVTVDFIGGGLLGPRKWLTQPR